MYICIQLSRVALITEPMLNCGEGWLRTPQASFSTCPGIFSDVPRHFFRRAQASFPTCPGIIFQFSVTVNFCMKVKILPRDVIISSWKVRTLEFSTSNGSRWK